MQIILDKISFKYNGISFNNIDYVLKDYSCTINSNLTHIVGPNGSGKSTLLNILAGKTVYDGNIYINNELVDKNTLSKQCVLVDQKVNLFENITVLKNIKILAGKIDYDLINEFKLNNFLKKKVKELSGGYKKKLMILIALTIKPKILLLDEYSNYLDKEFLDILNKKLIEYSNNNVVIYVDHLADIGGNVVYINETYEVSMPENITKSKSKFKFEYHFRTERLSYLVLIFFIFAVQMFYSVKTANPNDMYCDYLINNNLNFNNTYLYENAEKDPTVMKMVYMNSKTPVILFDEEVFIVEEKKESNEKYCYVFSYNKDLLDTYVDISGVKYLVCGYVKYNESAIPEYLDIYGYHRGYLVPNNEYENQIKSYYDKYVKYSTRETIKNDMQFITKYCGTAFPDLTKFEIVYIISYAFFLVFCILSYSIINIFEKKENNIFSSYNRCAKDLNISNIIIHTVDILVCSLIACLSANIGAKIFIKYSTPLMDPQNVFDISRIPIVVSTILIYMIIKVIFVSFRKVK